MILLDNIHQTYRSPKGPVHALRGVNLQIRAGEVFGVIGRSGAGKSSLVRTINLLNRPSQGTVTVAGRSLTTLNAAGLREARRDIGMVFQHFNLLTSRTVYDNVALPLELAGLSRQQIKTRVNPLLELVGLGALADRYPAQISGGQKQRVGIARALASQPKVLLSDEATSALDPETTRAILALLQAGQIVEQGEALQVFSHPQNQTTRSLLDDVVPRELPANVLERVRALLGVPGQPPASLLRLVFAGVESDRPLLSDLVRRFGLDLNIVHGQIDEVQGHPFGTLAVLASGAREQLTAAVGHLRGAGVQVQEVAHA